MKKKKITKITESYRQYVYVRQHDLRDLSVPSGLFFCERIVPKKKRSPKRADPNVSNLGYRFCGYPDDDTIREFNQNIGNCRYLWNRMTSDYRNGNELRTPAGYKKDEACSWLAIGDSVALCNTQKAFHKALSDYLSGDKGAPRFKKKRYAKRSYTTSCSNAKDPNLWLEGDQLHLPKISRTVTLDVHRKIIPGGRLKSCTVTHDPDGRWYFSLIFEYPLEEEIFSPALTAFFEDGDLSDIRHLGLDMSVPKLYVDSDGNDASYGYDDILVSFEKSYLNAEKKLAREQRKLSRMIKDSSNYQKQKLKIARLHAKIKHQRTDFLHQLSVRLARTYDVISIEDLDMRAMKKSLSLGKSVSDNGWGNFTAMLERKLRKNGGLLLRVDRWFPSSKTCSACGHVHKELQLSDRTYECPVCGSYIDRDVNAAVNIDSEGIRILLSLSTGRDAGDSLSDYGMTAHDQSVSPVTQEGFSTLAS